MRYKYLAFIIIFFLSGYISFRIRKYSNDKIKFHVALIDFITHIRQQITFYCTPTDRIIKEYHDPAIGDCSLLMEGKTINNIYTDERGRKVLNDFFKRLGKSAVEGQIANCDYALSSISTLLSEYIDEKDKKYKAYSMLSLIIGGLLIILLI